MSHRAALHIARFSASRARRSAGESSFSWLLSSSGLCMRNRSWCRRSALAVRTGATGSPAPAYSGLSLGQREKQREVGGLLRHSSCLPVSDSPSQWVVPHPKPPSREVEGHLTEASCSFDKSVLITVSLSPQNPSLCTLRLLKSRSHLLHRGSSWAQDTADPLTQTWSRFSARASFPPPANSSGSCCSP